jgi:hypothetical protein
MMRKSETQVCAVTDAQQPAAAVEPAVVVHAHTAGATVLPPRGFV